jgi:hypothetical protein
MGNGEPKLNCHVPFLATTDVIIVAYGSFWSQKLNKELARPGRWLRNLNSATSRVA